MHEVKVAPSAVHTHTEAALARRALAVLRKGSQNRQALKAKLGLPPKARIINDVLRKLVAAGILAYEYAWPSSRYSLAREPEPGELYPPRREFEILVEAIEAGACLEVRAVRFLDTTEERIQVRRVIRFPDGGVKAHHVVGLTTDNARTLAAALEVVADRMEP